MTDDKNEMALTVTAKTPAIYNKTSQVSAIQRAQAGAADYVPHVTVSQVTLMAMVTLVWKQLTKLVLNRRTNIRKGNR